MLSHKPVLTKKDFARRYAKGEFGNRPPTWDSFEDWCKEFPSPRMCPAGSLYHLRNRVAGGLTFYNVSPTTMISRYYEAQDQGVSKEQIYVSQMIPKQLEKTLLIQGEVQQDPTGESSLYLFYTTIPLPMRDALATESHHAKGLLASTILQYHMCPNSWEWLNVLLKRYPGHVIEFSTYPKCWGSVPGYNSVFWEVRAY